MGMRKEQRRQAKQKERQKKITAKTLAERVPEKLLAALEEVDDLMFRHDFATAGEILGELAERWPNRSEILNRQVNVCRDVPNEVAKRLRHAGFAAELNGDGVLAVKG